MSVIVDFFVAPDDPAAASALGGGPEPGPAAFSCGNLDPEEAVLHWEALLTGGRWDDLADEGEPRTVAEARHGESWIFALSPCLVRALATAGPDRLRSAARDWARLSAEAGAALETEVAKEILREVAALATVVAEREGGLYCRVG
ncbi:hypothetical protein [Streptomyces sp. NPDC056600]|uniref:hypothetical protein n=1 Tax=Streptomyces sp. NPDC056600 TaxID=3345874 RepID=UPI0036999865